MLLNLAESSVDPDHLVPDNNFDPDEPESG